MTNRIIFLVCVLLTASVSFGQTKKDTATVDALIAESRKLAATDSAKAISLATQAKEMAAELRDEKGEANALKYIGMVYYQKGKYAETLDYWLRSLTVFESTG